MATNKLQLKVGGRYKTRDGRVATIEKDLGPGADFPLRGSIEPGGGEEECWLYDGSWYFPGSEDGRDLVSEIPDESPEYRYFRCPLSNTFFPDSRWRSEGGPVYFNDGDGEWVRSSYENLDELISSRDLVECLEDGSPLEPEPDNATFKTTEDLTDPQRSRIAKLAARIVLADGPVLTVDELAGMTVAELVAKLETVTPAIEL